MSELIDRQALRAAHGLGSDCHDCKRDMKSCQYDRDYSLMDFCEWLDDAPTASPWHRVEEELPKEKNWVLVWHTGYATPKKAKFIVDVIPEFLFDGGGGAWELDGWSDNKGKVTHWMPLPEPPKEDA